MQDQYKRTPLREMPRGRDKVGTENDSAAANASSSSSEFMKLYSPMADRLAEAARSSHNGVTFCNSVSRRKLRAL